MKVRVSDIATAAGVSTATVDRVLNNRPGVHARTSERVRQAFERLQEMQAMELENNVGTRTARKRVDFLIPTGTNVFLQAMAEEVERRKEEFLLFGVEPKSHHIAGFDPFAIAQCLRQVSKESDGICLVAIDHPVVREAINEAASARVPVVSLVSDISNSRQFGYVGIDNYAAGRLAGYLMGRFLPERKATVALIAGSLTYRGHTERDLGFRRILQEEFHNLRIVDVKEGHDEDEQTFAVARDLLSRHSDLAGIYNIGGGFSGVANALIESGHEKTVLIAHELNPITRGYLINGVIDALITQNFAIEVRNAIRMIMNFHAGRDALANVEQVPIEVYFRENLPWRV